MSPDYWESNNVLIRHFATVLCCAMVASGCSFGTIGFKYEPEAKPPLIVDTGFKTLSISVRDDGDWVPYEFEVELDGVKSLTSAVITVEEGEHVMHNALVNGHKFARLEKRKLYRDDKAEKIVTGEMEVIRQVSKRDSL